mgnify:CR=1 FL=1
MSEAQTAEISRTVRLLVGALVARAGGKLSDAEAALVLAARDALRESPDAADLQAPDVCAALIAVFRSPDGRAAIAEAVRPMLADELRRALGHKP